MTSIDLSANRIVDISQPVHNGMWDYRPLDVPVPPVDIQPIATIENDGYNLERFTLNGLSGAYIESARHMNPDAPFLDGFDPRTLIRPAKLMRLPPAEPYRLYTPDDLEKANPGIQEGDAIIMVTGWDAHRNEVPDYVTTGPALAYSTLEWFCDQPFSMWGIDITVANCLWAEQEIAKAKEAGDETRVELLEKQIGTDLLGDMYKRKPQMRLLAPLANLTTLQGDEGTVLALGVNIPDVCAVPARVLFIEGAVLRT